MKKYIITITFLTVLFCHAQNLVPNGNFESGSYDGGTNPIEFYFGVYTGNWWSDLTNSSTHNRIDASMQGTWYVAKADKIYNGKRRDSPPDWIDPNQWYNTEHDGNCTNTKYVRCAYPNESIMVRMENKAKLFELDTVKFRHSIDLRYVYDITLGYNFSYYFLPKRLGVGTRVGIWYKKKENFPGGIYSRYGMKFSGDLYLDLTIWRSISLQMGAVFQNELTWPSKENPINDSGKLTDWAVAFYLKPTFIVYKHYMISAGVNCFSYQPYEFYLIRPVVAIGYKF